MRGSRVLVTELKGGTLTSSARMSSSLLVRLVDLLPALHGVTGVGRVWNASGWGDRVVGTLLGPEGTGRP
jgi:hypothetical protein